MAAQRGVVLFGDVVRSRQWPSPTADWLSRLCRELDADYAHARLAGFEFTQGDEIQGLLATDADPFHAVLTAMLRSSAVAPEMRWAIVAGSLDPGRGPATRRSGAAFVTARETIKLARQQKDDLLVRTGLPDFDDLLDGTAPVLGSLLVRLTDRQRQMARFALIDGLRQSEVADRLSIRRATVSVAFARADVRSLTRLLGAVRGIWASAIDALDR